MRNSLQQSFLTINVEHSIKKHIPWYKDSHRLWSLRDMLKFAAKEYIGIGELFEILTDRLRFPTATSMLSLTEEERKVLRDSLQNIKDHCDEIDLKISSEQLDRLINNLPESHRELEMLRSLIDSEMKEHLFLFVPSNRAEYYNRSFNDQLTKSFSKASKELVSAGNCFTVGEYTSCVFHSMRALELGLRSLAIHLNVTLPFPLELALWQELIDKIEKEIRLKEQLPKGKVKDEELTFCSQAAMQFSYFKNAYRNHVSHTRETYSETESERVMEHTREFLETLATRITELVTL